MATKIEVLKAKAESIYLAVEDGYIPTSEDIALLAKVEEYEEDGWPTYYYGEVG